MFLRILLNKIIKPVRPIEEKIIETLGKKLSPQAGEILNKQFQKINYVQRLSNGKEVHLYNIKNFKPYFDEKIQYPARNPEVKFASITFKTQLTSEKYQADIWLVNGYLFSIEFNKTPKNIRHMEIEIKTTEILIDPMVEPEKYELLDKHDLKLNDWLRKWADLYPIENAKKPLQNQERDKILKNLNIKFPNDYIELISVTEGFNINKCRVYGISEIRTLAMNDEDYYILCEIDSKGVISIKQNSEDSILYYFDYEENIPKNIGTSLTQAIEREIKRKTASRPKNLF